MHQKCMPVNPLFWLHRFSHKYTDECNNDILKDLISFRGADMYHRDFKTANFLVPKTRKILINDFGTSRDEKLVDTFVKAIGTLWYRCLRLGDCGDKTLYK
ncbi:hypothetical protein ACTFIR_000052 [Dictyostelium discoideum]